MAANTLMKKLMTATETTRNRFPWPPGLERKTGDTEKVAHLFDFFGLFFDEERSGHVFTTLHTLLGTSAAEMTRALDSIAASACTSGMCFNPACPLRASAGGFKELSLCSRCRLVGYCGIPCQREHWPAHKAPCKNAAKSLAASSVAPAADEPITLGDSAKAFSRSATAATIGASGPIAMLSWIWRSKSGYKGEIPNKGFLPPVVLIELEDSVATNWEPPTAMRISELYDPLCANSDSAWLAALRFPELFVRLITDTAPKSIGAQVRSGERVMCVVTTPAHDPQYTKWLTLVHCVPVPLLSRKLKRIERAVESDGVDSMYGMPVLEARYIVARPVFGDEVKLLFGSRAKEDSISDSKADQAFCNMQLAQDFSPDRGIAHVHALLISDCELVKATS